MSADVRAKRIEELTADITSLGDRIKLLQKQRVRDEQLKQYLRASAIEEEILKIRTEKRRKEEEVLLIQKKQAKAKWYKEKQSPTSSYSSSSSDEIPAGISHKVHSLSKLWAKSVATGKPFQGKSANGEPLASINGEKKEEASSSEIQPIPHPFHTEKGQEVDNKISHTY